ncbi:thymidylate synthase [Acinetobacter calcoaceticus]|uniref:thymidylate synthase n=1 Tax=Acinetobacter calcoaceticus TaxID=471 RepID=UPI001E511A0A|nr:thymidylate synthase [Acinetobacter calcoaceticus]UGQ26109.1 thymidylate synthase [Acinetobacter calcoaceticus]
MHIKEKTLDDLLNSTYTFILEKGDHITASKGENFEVRNAVLTLENPRSRLSISETRSKLISCIGEFFWYLNGSDSLEFIEYYISDYRKYIEYQIDENKPALGAYGPRIFGAQNQFNKIIEVLKDKPTSRRAVISIYSKDDLLREDSRDIPCTCLLQFFIRNERLHLTATMRSNDAAIGLVHDIFSFTLIQELLLAKLIRYIPNLQLGEYTHIVGSLHIYKKNIEGIRHYLDNEGWQNITGMFQLTPELLDEDLPKVMDLEQSLRSGSMMSIDVINDLKDPFWKELAVILFAYRFFKNMDLYNLNLLKNLCQSDPVIYFLAKKSDELIEKGFSNEIST